MKQLYQICVVPKPTTKETSPSGIKMVASLLNFKFPQIIGSRISFQTLAKMLKCIPKALDLIFTMCSWNQKKRPTMSQAFQHPLFTPLHRQCITFAYLLILKGTLNFSECGWFLLSHELYMRFVHVKTRILNLFFI